MDHKPKVVIAEAVAETAVAALVGHAEVDIAVGVPIEELKVRLADAAALIVRSATKVDAELIAAAPLLKVIGRAGIGVDNIDLDSATAAGIMVVNAPDANTISAAEHTMALLLAQARRVPEADASLRAGRWDRKLFNGVELHGKTLGILGLGRIGTLVAQRASSFGLTVVAYDPFVSEDRAAQIGARMVELDEALSTSDFITIHLPRTRDTEGLLDAARLSRAKRGIRIINVARGGIVDEQALADAVRSGHVAGAAIDVFAIEPTTESPLFELPQIVVTPHLGASTQEAQDKAGVSVAESIVAALGGALVPAAVNLAVGPPVSAEARPFLALAEDLGQIFARFAHGLPSQLTVTVQGSEASDAIRAISLAAVKGVLRSSTDEPVSFVNAPSLAAARGMTVREVADPEGGDYRTMVIVSGDVDGTGRTIAGSVMAHRGAVLVEVDGYDIEFPIAANMLLVRNSDTPGVIGRVGTILGDSGLNVADMAVGRAAAGGAMMGLTLDGDLTDDIVATIQAADGVLAARAIRLD